MLAWELKKKLKIWDSPAVQCLNLERGHVQTCLIMSNLVRTFANMSEHVQASQNICKHVWTCPNIFKYHKLTYNDIKNSTAFNSKSNMYHFSSCFDMFQQVQTCSDLFRIAYLWWSLKKSTAFDSIRSKVSCLLLKYTAKSVANMASSMHTITRL